MDRKPWVNSSLTSHVRMLSVNTHGLEIVVRHNARDVKICMSSGATSKSYSKRMIPDMNPFDSILIKRHSASAIVPQRNSHDAVGYDLFADVDHDTPIFIGQRTLIPTNISIAIPHGLYGRIAPRSGLALKHGIDMLAGVIDPDYRGTLGVMLINLGQQVFHVKHGDRIGQLIFERCETPHLFETDILPSTDRGNGGFGSTG